MPTLNAGQSATINVPPGMPLYVSSGGDAYVDIVAGVNGAGYTSERLRAPRASKLFGPWSVAAVLAVRCNEGTASYGGGYNGEAAHIGSRTPSELTAIHAAIAAGRASYPVGATVDVSGYRLSLQGLGASAAFSSGGGGSLPLSITGEPVSTGSIGQPYTFQAYGFGGTAPYTYAVVSGSLPAGVTLNTGTGVVSGTPSTAASSTFSIRVTDSASASATLGPITVVISAAAATAPGAPTIGTATAGDGTVSVAFTAPASNGGSPILDYQALLSTGQTATGASSPISVTAPNETPVTATVRARNAVGYGPYSASPSNSVTPTDGDGLLAYVGQVGSRAILPRQRLGTSKQFNSKAFHRLAQAVPSPIFDFAGFMGANAVTTPTGTGDLAVGSTMALRASVEYPPGVFTRLQFGGSDTGTVPDRGILSADPATNLFAGAADGVPFYVWANGVFASAGLPVIYSTIPADNNYSLLGEAYEHAVSGLADKSGGGSITNAGGAPGLVYRCVGIRGETTKRSFCVIGDSRQAGFSGILHDANGQQGTIPRAVTDSGRGVTVCSIGGDLASVWSTPANVSARAPLMDTASDVVICHSINDIAAGATAAEVQARITTIVNAAVAKGKRVGRATINPRTTSTDNWATPGNQTPVAQESVRVAVNDWLRNPANFPGDSYLIDLADMVEVNVAGVATRNGGRWRTAGALSTTADGLHESLALNQELSAGIRAAMGI